MKTRIAISTMALAAVFSPVGLQAVDEIRPGDSQEQVERVLGTPRGWIQSGAYQLLTYERGKVEIREGRVEYVDILSEEEHERRLREREIRADERREAQASRRAQRVENGNALKDRMISDISFLSSDSETQLRFWRQFKQRYPEVPAGLEYRDALASYEREEDARRTERDMQVAAQRLLNLNREADQAERQAEKAEKRADRAMGRRRVAYYGVSTPCVTTHKSAPRIEYYSPRVGYLPSTLGGGIGNRSHFRQTYSAGHSYVRTPLVSSRGLTLHIRN